MNLPHEFKEAHALLIELNEKFELECNGCTSYRPFVIELHDSEWVIKLLGLPLWSSDDDTREEIGGEVEPLNDLILREANKILRAIAGVRLPGAPEVNVRVPVPELAGSFATVLYFGSEQDRQEFIDAVKAAKPGMSAIPL